MGNEKPTLSARGMGWRVQVNNGWGPRVEEIQEGLQFYAEQVCATYEHDVGATAETIVRDATIRAGSGLGRLGLVSQLFKNIYANHIDSDTYQ